jgi:hypothetical protein
MAVYDGGFEASLGRDPVKGKSVIVHVEGAEVLRCVF